MSLTLPDRSSLKSVSTCYSHFLSLTHTFTSLRFHSDFWTSESPHQSTLIRVMLFSEVHGTLSVQMNSLFPLYESICSSEALSSKYLLDSLFRMKRMHLSSGESVLKLAELNDLTSLYQA